MSANEAERKFTLGQILATPGVLESVPNHEMLRALSRHVRGDWGDVCPEDARENELSLTHNLRFLSSYTTEAGVKFWIITEADRSATTVLLPEEY
jgi:hypothetical protein